MKLNDLQLNSIYLEEISDEEAAKINGGATTTASSSAEPASFSMQLAALKASFAQAQRQNILMRQVVTEEGTELNAAKKDVNPK